MGEEAVEAIQRLEPCVQNYAWGVMGSNSSLVSRMAGGTPDASKPYAELWMGTHPSAPSKVAGQGLSEFLKKNESFAGVTSQHKWSWQVRLNTSRLLA
jgi:mannose-6-phosphate isomerase